MARELLSAQQSSGIKAGVLTGDEYIIEASGSLDEDAAVLTFTLKLTRLEGHSSDQDESYKVCTAFCDCSASHKHANRT